ncbi:TonB-dependent receptor [Sphingobium lactosutens]|nr:TonB-dependent receptor [Sphingobium lactosutens]
MRYAKSELRGFLMAASTIAIMAGAGAGGAQAQEAQAIAPQDDAGVTDIVVTGYRASLQNSTNAKREAIGFTDSIFAQDIGKFPDTNIAESFNRIPGITISRDVNGEGVNVAIRGLGSNFTNVTLNGAPIAVSSSGATDAQGTDRSVDLSFFPTDLFTKLTVNKSYTANLLEGGAAGNIDMRSARPFDRPGTRFTYNLQGAKQSGVDKIGARGSAIFSTTNDTMGILVGVSGQRLHTDNRGFETIGYTNPNLTAAQCGTATNCNATGGGNWTIPATVPAGAGAGTVAGQTIDQAWLLANNPGATIQQIDNGLLPRLGRFSAQYGRRDRINAIASAEFRPTDAMHFYIDGLYGYKKNDLKRENIAWIVRNSQIIPTNTTYDREDCSAGCLATGGTYANSQFFLEYRPLIETTKLYSINPGLDWELADRLKLSIQANYTRSTFHREVPTVGPVTALGQGVNVTYSTNSNGAPTIDANVDLNDPNNFVWTGGRLNMQDERRLNKTKGIRGSLNWGDENFAIQGGANYDDISRRIRGFDNTSAWQNAVCGGNPSVTLPSPNSQPPCQGLATVPADAGYPTYPGYGTGYTAGQTGTVNYGGSLIPTGQLPNFLMPGRAGFVTVDWDKFKQASNYDFYHDNAPESGGSNTGASGGLIREKSWAAYLMATGKQQIGDNDLRFNIGARYVHTDQTIEGRVSLTDPRNTPDSGGQLPDGSRYPNIINFVRTSNSYDKWLPAATLAYNLGDNAVVRAAFSETMTRPDPAAQLPGVGFGDPSAATATIGNPALEPYYSRNLDFGVDLYTGREGLISLNAFRKSLTGFTTNQITTQPFSFLAQYGITYDSLNPTQREAINLRGGPTVATVQIQTQVNVPNKLTVNGLEFQWVQPLDFLTERYLNVRGFGFNANATIVDQRSDGPATAFGVSPFTYNVIGYYENGGVNLRVSTTFREGSQSSGLNQNGIPAAGLFNDDYQQWDFSSSFDLEELFGWKGAPQVTLDIQNFTNSTLRSYFQFEGATFTQYKPGVQYFIGVRGSF